MDAAKINAVIQKDLLVKRNCEACEVIESTWLLRCTTGRIVGIFHVCGQCKFHMTFDTDDYEFIEKIKNE